MGGMSLMHWLIVILILLIFFGPSRLPELGKGLGEAIRGFKKGISDDQPMDSTQRRVATRSHPNQGISQSEPSDFDEVNNVSQRETSPANKS